MSNSASAASSVRAARQPPFDHLGRLGAAAGQPPHELVPAGRREEDELGVRHGLPHQTGALQVDLQQHRLALLQLLQHGARGACRTGCRRTRPTPAVRRWRRACRTPRRPRSSTARRASRRAAAGGWWPRRTARPRGGACADGRRPCSCRPRRGRRARSAAACFRGCGGRPPGDSGSHAAIIAVSPGQRRRTQAGPPRRSRRRTPVPGRRSGWSRDRGRGGSRRSRAAP